uniref:SJCHGC03049 protein n=1 Tax=Schistosoma japonicum TaxID=6182 RepID=Q5BSZ0_SCHJA|nr:SJCHGC03049 protein [Schistosoma japonicum]
MDSLTEFVTWRLETLLGMALNKRFALIMILAYFLSSGKRFQYTYYDQSKGPIWQSIQALDEAVS